MTFKKQHISKQKECIFTFLKNIYITVLFFKKFIQIDIISILHKIKKYTQMCYHSGKKGPKPGFSTRVNEKALAWQKNTRKHETFFQIKTCK